MDFWLMMTVCFLSMLTVRCVQLECSTERRCKCRKYFSKTGGLFANCQNLSLKHAPRFNEMVTGVNLARNNISEFPSHLPKGTTYLNLSRNLLYRINQTSLSHYPMLNNFDISNNKLEEIEMKAFENCSALQYLNISNNQQLTIEVISNISFDLRSSNSIKSLEFEYLQCKYGVSLILKRLHLIHLKMTYLEELNLASNRIHSLESGVLGNLPKSLKVLNLNDNVLSFGIFILEFSQLENLRTLYVSFQSTFHQAKLYTVVKQCNDTKPNRCVPIEGSSPQVQIASKEISTEHEMLRGFKRNPYNLTIYAPPKLERFYFHDNMYKTTIPKLIIEKANFITHCYLQNSIIYELDGPMFGTNKVQYMDFSNNICHYISPTFFADAKSLTYLDLSQNALGRILEDDIKGEIFQNIRQLSSLNLSLNRLVNLPVQIFQNLRQMQFLNLSFNSIGEFVVNIAHMKTLNVIDLSHNQLAEIDASTREALTSLTLGRKIQVNLIGNRLRCTCENLDFLIWMQKSSNIRFLYLQNYTCTLGNSSIIQLGDIDSFVDQMVKHCASYTLIIVLMSLLVSGSMATLIGRIIYRYRWKLRYMYYVARDQYQSKGHKEEGKCRTSFHFDAFVSYADEDQAFLASLVKRLEKEYDLRLCIHHRDFIPGSGIADNISNAIHSSQRTVCLMTSHFLESYWCLFELNMARMEAIYSRDGSNVLLLVVLEKGVVKKFPLFLMDLIESKSYLEYPASGDEDEKTAFFSKLGETLKSY